jgi:hypothetical protein
VSDDLDHEPLLEPEHVSEIAAVVRRILDDWGVEPGDQALLLGSPAPARGRGRRGAPLPLAPDRATLARLSHLLSIERAVRTAFPHNAVMARYWVTTPHPLFSDQTPLAVMLAGGVEGMERIVGYLNCTETW